MKVLIIGGTGLISTAITRQLIQRGDSVTHFNRGRTPVRTFTGVSLIEGDRKEYPAFEARMRDEQWDAVIDMVGFVPDDVSSAIRALAGHCSHYIYCSTVCTYGGPLTHLPATEAEPQRPISSYGRNKVACEQLALAAHAAGRLPVTIMRPSHTYGEGGGIVHSVSGFTSFVDRIRRGLPVVVHGDGSSLWSSCYIDDVAKGFVGALNNSQALGGCYNLTGEEWVTWNEYVEGIATAVGGTANIVHIPTDALAVLAPDKARGTVEIFQYNSVFDNCKANNDLGFKQTVKWVEGVGRNVQWLDSVGRIPTAETEPEYQAIIDAWGAAMAGLGALKNALPH